MKFAFLGDDEAISPLLEYLIASSNHDVVSCADSMALLDRWSPQARIRALAWQDFLADRDADAVIIAARGDEQLDTARQLAAAGRPLLLLPYLPREATLIHELAFLQSEQRLVIIPLFWHRGVPLLQAVRSGLAQGSAGILGKFQHLRLHHVFVPRDASSELRERIDRALLDDIDLLRFLGGDYNQISATGDAALPTLTLELKGESLPPAQWLAGAGDRDELRLELTGERSALRLTRDAARTWRLDPTCSAAGKTDWKRYEAATGETGFAAAEWIVTQVEQAIDGNPVRIDLDDLSRAAELREAIGESQQRRRTIDVHYEAPSERNTFKSRMTALGCMVLMGTVAAMSLFLMITAAFRLPPVIANVGRVLVFAPLVLFLIAQLLVFVAKPPRKPESPR